MHRPSSAVKRVTLMLALSLSVLAAACASAQASASPAWGELERFGEAGEELGKLNNAEPALGVDPEDNSVFVVDETHEYSFLRIQKFSNVGGKYKEVASREFVPPDPSGNEELGNVRGVAVDPSLGRVYVLAVQTRSKKKKAIEGATEAADALYAFKTTNLESAVTGETEGILAGPTTLLTESQALGAGGALLEPSGIAVDPENHDVVIVAEEDRLSEEKKEDVKTIVVQQVGATGTLGARWEDVRTVENPETHKLEEGSYFEADESCTGCTASSPVVTSGGNIYVRAHALEEGQSKAAEIVEIPKSLKNAEAPVEKYRNPATDELFGFVQGPSAAWGGVLSIGPAKEGSEQRLYALARIGNGKERDTLEEGALVLNGAAEELGYTGGGSLNVEAGACDLQQGKNSGETGQWPVLAAGKGETLFVLGREPVQFNPENYPLAAYHIVEFGPEGHSCPTAAVTEPTVAAGAETGLSQVGLGEKVKLESALVQPGATEAPNVQAEALSVEWNFGDGTSETIATRQATTSVVQHEFKQLGTLTVTEKVHTDDLASPLIEVKRQITVVGPPVVTTDEGQVDGTTVTLIGSVDTFGPAAEKCEFEYGTTLPSHKSVPCDEKPEGEEAQEVKAPVAGLAPNTTYHFKLIVTTKKGSGEGKEVTFVTGAEASAPSVTAAEATSVNETSAMLNAKVNPEAANVTKCEFEYGPGETFANRKGCASLPGAGSSAVGVSAVVAGLSPGTSYSYRLVAENSVGAKVGSVVHFTTTKAPECTVDCGGGSGGPPNTGTGTTQTAITPPPVVPPPAVTLTGATAAVASSGAFAVKASCPAGVTSCSGTIAVQTISAVVAGAKSAKSKAKAAILTLATGSFTLAAGQTKVVTLHLTSRGRALLSRLHAVRVKVTLVAHDPAGGSHTTSAAITLRLAAPHKHG